MPENKDSKISDIFEFDKLWDYSNPSDTEKKFKDLLPEIKSSGNKSAYLQLLTQIGRTLGLQMKFDEAHKVLDDAEIQLSEEYFVARIRYLLERGRAYNSSKQKEKAIDFFLKAYDLGKKSGEDYYTVDAAHMLGIAETLEKGLEWNMKAIEMAENSADERTVKWLGSLYNNTAWTYHDKKEYEKALELFEKNVKWHTEKNSERPLIIAKWSVARALRSLNKIDEALKAQNELLKEIKEKGLVDDGYIYEELGECYHIKNNKDEAVKYFGLAYDLLSKDIWLAEYEKERLQRLRELGGR